MCNMEKMIFILGVLFFAVTNGAPTNQQTTIYDSLVRECPSLANITDFGKQKVFEMCKDNISLIVKVKVWSPKTMNPVMCLLYYNSVKSFCSSTKLVTRNQVIPNTSALDITNVCKDFPEIHNLTNGIFTETKCPIYCETFEQNKDICGLSYKIYRESNGIATEVKPNPNVSKVVPAYLEQSVKTTVTATGTSKIIADTKPPIKEQVNQVKKPQDEVIPPPIAVQTSTEKSTELQVSANSSDLIKKNEQEISVPSTTVDKQQSKPAHQSELKTDPAKKPEIKQDEENLPEVKPTTKQAQKQLEKDAEQETIQEVKNQEADQVKAPEISEQGVKTISDNTDGLESQDPEISNPNQKLPSEDIMEGGLDKEDAYDDDIPQDLTAGKGMPQKSKIIESSNVSNDDLDGESDFFSYFMVICLMIVLGYVAYHNRQKLFALMIEGKRGKRQYRGRRPNSANYHKLDSNLEEAITSDCSKSTSHIIY